MPVSIIPGLGETDLEGSIYTYIEDKLGLYIESGHRNDFCTKKQMTLK